MEFPTPSDAINETMLHPRLLGAVSQLLGTHVWDLRLTQSETWAEGCLRKAAPEIDQLRLENASLREELSTLRGRCEREP